MHVSYLMMVQQKDLESLKDYIYCFQKERLAVVMAPGNLILMVLLNGIHPQNSLALKMAHKPPADLQEFMEKATEFINGKESIRALTVARQATAGTLKKESPKASLLPKRRLINRKGKKKEAGCPARA